MDRLHGNGQRGKGAEGKAERGEYGERGNGAWKGKIMQRKGEGKKGGE